MKTVVNGIEIYYEDRGHADAPALIFIHGFPLDHTMWLPQMEALKGQCRVVAYDLRGHGDSGVGEEFFSMELFVQDLLKLMDALRIEEAILCALSMGGYIALRAILDYPERFNGLILCDTQCTADTDEGKARRTAAIKAIYEDGIEPFAEGLLGKMFAPSTFERNPEAINKVRQMILNTSELSLERSLIAMREREETCSKLPNITVPTLMLVGDQDGIAPPEASRYLYENIENAQLTVIEEAGHMSNMENPVRFCAALEKFIEEINYYK